VVVTPVLQKQNIVLAEVIIVAVVSAVGVVLRVVVLRVVVLCGRTEGGSGDGVDDLDVVECVRYTYEMHSIM